MSEHYKYDGECDGCQYHSSAKLPDGSMAHMCGYTSALTAWACVKEEMGDSYGSMHMGENEGKIQN